MTTTRAVLAWVLAMAACTAGAEAMTVEAVQYPAWLERGARSVPLTPGLALQPSDRIRTGGAARVRLRLPEGSAVRLGENAQFVIESADDRGIFRATLGVIAGAFRFTTDALSKSRGRDIAIKVKNVTAGIRGTDLWGKSTAERDLVCLLEGRISVGAAGHPEVTLAEPGAYYQKPRGGDPVVARVDQRQIDAWSLETEIAADGPAASLGGDWRVVVAVLPTRDAALVLNRRLRAAGFPAEVAAKDGFIAVHVPGLAGEMQARALMARLREVEGVVMPTVHPMPSR